MMIINGINDNILIRHPSYLGVYQYEAKNEISKRDKCFWGVETKPKKLTKQWCTFIHQRWYFYIPLHF